MNNPKKIAVGIWDDDLRPMNRSYLEGSPNPIESYQYYISSNVPIFHESKKKIVKYLQRILKSKPTKK